MQKTRYQIQKKIANNFLSLLGVDGYKIQKYIYSSKVLDAIYQNMPKRFLRLGIRCVGIKSVPQSEIKISLPLNMERNTDTQIIEIIIIKTLKNYSQDNVIFSEKGDVC